MAKLLTTKEAAARLGMAEHTLAVWRITGKGPKFIKLGRSVRYSEDELTNYETENSWQSTSELSAALGTARR
jgi:predicted DNA-binding transcriptional regulator AlpA